MAYTLQEGYFPSHNKEDEIYYRIMTPKEIPVGIVLLLHGMQSHSGQYEDFAAFLCENGYVVCAYDQAGHGKSVKNGRFGSFAAKDGDVVLVKDIKAMVEIVRKRYRHLPLFLYGHSMGSFAARAYVAAHPDDFDGAIFSGTCERMEVGFFRRSKLKRLVKKAGRAPSAAVEKMMVGDFAAAFPEKGSWVTTNPDAFAKNDPFAGHPMCADGFYDMFKLMTYISSDEWLQNAPSNLPMLFLSGARDPLGGGGDGIRELVGTLSEMGVSDVTCRIYEGEKHETLGSLSDAVVREDILTWLKEKTADKVALQKMQYFSGFSS